jgi:Tol biopolymer transport system component/predicted amidohydrolase
VIRGVLFAALFSLGAVAAAHEEDFPLPLLAQAGGTGAVSDSARPSQPAGQTLPLRPTRTIDFTTDEGTWMSVDLAPNGQRIVFDLLGDLYEIDSSGGEAKALTRGMGFDAQPTYSPDGQWIAFISDRSGAENVWVMRNDGSDLRQVSLGGDDTVLVSPAWAPDGKSIYVSRFRWSLHNYELWRYELNGTEQLVVPIQDEGGNRKSTLGAVVSPDGRYVYFARRVGNASPVQLDDWSIVRRDVATGAEETMVTEPNAPGRQNYSGAYFRPALSHDGNWLAYATCFDGQTGLRLRDLRTGADRWLAFPIERDQIGAQSWQDLVPRYAFTPDDSAIILSRRGKFERLPIAAGEATPIPFTAKVALQLGPLTRVAVKEETGPVRARLMQTPEQSPDGKWLAFSALGHVYVMPLNGHGKPRRLTSGETPEFQPSWSPDGRTLAFITWTAANAGQVWTVPLAGGAPRQITEAAAYYSFPVFTPDGQAVIAVRSDNTARLHSMMEFGRQIREAALVTVPLAGGTSRVIAKGTFGGKPHFSSDANLAYLHTAAGLSSVHLSTGEIKAFSDVKGPGWYFQDGPVPVDESRLSPDGKYLLVNIAQQLHVLATPASGTTIDLSKPGLAHRRITDVGADFFEWADGGKTITWAVGSTFYRRPLADIKLNAADQPSWTADVSNKSRVAAFKAVVEVPRDDPRGSLLLRGARVITMRGDEIIDGGDILVRDGRIAAVGARGSIAAPAGATVQDVSGKTIVPGFIDIHDHVADIRRDVLSLDAWGLRARLAYGITTAFDPSSLSIDMFAYQDLIDAGIVTGSRLRTTGMAMFSFNRLASEQEARALLTRYRDHYRTSNVKQYLIGNRMQRQWIAQAAAEMGVMPTTEGSLSLKLDLTQIMDGFAGNEHALPTPLYRDVVELVARSRTSYDGTLQIDNGGAGAQDNLVIRDRPAQDPKFIGSRPYYVVAQTAMTRPWSEPLAMLYPRLGNDAARIQRAGGVIGMGSHGEIPGPGLHWEMEAHVHGGMTPMEALRAATIGSAEAIGRLHDLGSIEPGKLADLLILQTDPSVDIRHSKSIDQVMKGGRLYDSDTLDELWPRSRVQPPSWFAGERPDANIHRH